MRDRRGFNLIELVVVMAIVSLLVSLALPNLIETMHRSRQSKTIADLRALGNALERYAVQTAAYPEVENIRELERFFEPDVMKKVPTHDGWKHPLDIDVAENGTSYTLRSPGKDGAYDAAHATPEPAAEREQIATDFTVDLVLIDGVFVSGPAELLEAEG